MKVTYQRHQQRTQRATDFWLQVAADYNAGMSAAQIADRYVNPKTGQPYTRQHIYWILRKVSNL
ncbi:MAG: hypothetical protein WC871_02185 [Bacteroidales bacterium]|jgi:hypothetical protein